MNSRLNPYLGFKDNAREAMEFYKSVFGGELALNTFKEYQASQDPAEDDKIMHGALEVPNGMMLMGADTPNSIEYKPGSTISVSLSGDNEEELRGYYDKLLADGGMAPMPIAKAPWGDTFGMVVDKFGTQWMVNIAGKKE